MSKKHTVNGNPEVANAFVTACVAKRTVEFQPEWVNATDTYLDAAISGKYAPMLELGVAYHCVDTEGRNIMLIGTELGNVAIFQRTALNANVIVAQASPVMDVFIKQHLGEISAIDSIETLDWLTDIQVHFAAAEPAKREAMISMYGPVFNAEPNTTLDDSVEFIQPAAAEVNNKAADAPKASKQEANQTKSTTKEQDMNQANQTNAKATETKAAPAAKENQALTGWGVFWRVSGLAVLCVAVVAAIVLGVYYGAAYIAGLGLSTVTLYMIKGLVAVVSGGAIAYAVTKTVTWIRDIFDRKAPEVVVVAPSAAAA